MNRPVESATVTRTSQNSYQPALDGLRAIAVLLVIAFHTGLDHLTLNIPGGWLGVDLFFVLSGYLITTLLLREVERTGIVRLRNFYVRRVLRLAPLSVVLVAGMFLLHLAGFAPRAGPNWRGALAIVGYVSNWVFIGHKRWLGSLSHCWSLSIEEQFYFVWPVLLVLVVAVAPRFHRLVLGVLAVGGAVALALHRRSIWLAALSWNRYNPYAYGLLRPHRSHEWAYWFAGSFTRPDGLFVGCALAVALGPRPQAKPILRGLVAVGAVASVGAGWWIVVHAGHGSYPRFVPVWGLAVLNVCVATVVAHLVLSPSAPLARALASRPLVWVGQRSYGIYLFHPIVIIGIAVNAHLTGLPGLAAVLGATLATAAISYRWLEQPFLKRKARFRS